METTKFGWVGNAKTVGKGCVVEVGGGFGQGECHIVNRDAARRCLRFSNGAVKQRHVGWRAFGDGVQLECC